MLTVILWLGFLLVCACFVLMGALIVAYIVIVAKGVKSLVRSK